MARGGGRRRRGAGAGGGGRRRRAGGAGGGEPGGPAAASRRREPTAGGCPRGIPRSSLGPNGDATPAGPAAGGAATGGMPPGYPPGLRSERTGTPPWPRQRADRRPAPRPISRSRLPAPPDTHATPRGAARSGDALRPGRSGRSFRVKIAGQLGGKRLTRGRRRLATGCRNVAGASGRGVGSSPRLRSRKPRRARGARGAAPAPSPNESQRPRCCQDLPSVATEGA